MPNDRYLPRTTETKSIALACPQRNRQVLLAAWLVITAIVASWMLALLFPLGPSFANFQATRHDSPSVNSNSDGDSLKGDRLTSAKARGRNEVEPIGTQSPPVSTGERKIPMGCDLAFSRLVKTGNFTARCVTKIELPMQLRLALAG
jgi:hypothetical protein